MKAKLHSAVLIPLSIIGFMGFISYIAFVRPTKISDLISDRYYEEEIKYQEFIDEKKNANALEKKVEIKLLPTGINIRFPADFKTFNTKGMVHLLRYDQKNLDIKKNLTISNVGEVSIPSHLLKKGPYRFSLSWHCEGKKYLIQEDIIWTN